VLSSLCDVFVNIDARSIRVNEGCVVYCVSITTNFNNNRKHIFCSRASTQTSLHQSLSAAVAETHQVGG
jgi:hypothetical protein